MTPLINSCLSINAPNCNGGETFKTQKSFSNYESPRLISLVAISDLIFRYIRQSIAAFSFKCFPTSLLVYILATKTQLSVQLNLYFSMVNIKRQLCFHLSLFSNTFLAQLTCAYQGKFSYQGFFGKFSKDTK